MSKRQYVNERLRNYTNFRKGLFKNGEIEAIQEYLEFEFEQKING
jgi:hypothetical protein